MRKISLSLIAAFVLFANLGLAQSGWTDISANLPNFPYDTTISGSDTVFADLTDVFFVSDLEGWVTTYHPFQDTAAILHTTDGGNTWDLQETTFPCNSIWMLDGTEGYAGADTGIVYHTTNGGQFWDVVGTIGVEVTDLYFPAGETLGYVSGFNGVYCKVESQGLTPVSTNYFGNIYTTRFPDKDWGWWAGGNAMKRYRNSIWKADQNFPTVDIRAVSFIDTLRGIAVGDKIMRSGDGQNWSANLNYAPVTGTLNDVMMVDGIFGWAVGDAGQILRTGTSGDFWHAPADVNISADFQAVYFPSLAIGYASGKGLTLFKYDETVGVEKEIQQLKVLLYPNPTEGKIYVELDESGVSGHLVDLFGRLVRDLELMRPGMNQIDLGDLPAGIYLLRLEHEGRFEMRRIVLGK